MARKTRLIVAAAVVGALCPFPAQAATGGGVPPEYQGNRQPPAIVVDRAASVSEATTANIDGSFGVEEKGRVGPLDLCRYVELAHGRGYWPLHREHIAGTYWCFAYGSFITYRRTQTFWRVDPLCRREAHENHRISGGVGLTWVEIHSEVWFACHTPAWFELHDSLWMNIAYNAWGNWAVTDHNT
jgi:hypothetical protein